MIAPPLSPHGVIGICAPCHVANRDHYLPLLEGIRRFGFRVREADNLYSDTYGYLSTPQERAADFNQLVADPEVELILFGGGEGAVELLPHIDFDAIRRRPCRICSYSDGTTLLDAIWAQTGLETYYGQSPNQFADLSPYNAEQFLQHLVRDDGHAHVAAAPWQPQTPGAAEGVLVGGYSTNFALLLGSRYFRWSPGERHLLFIEDHEKYNGPASVSAILSNIEQSDFMQTVSGLLFGHYSTDPRPDLKGLLRRFGERHHIPVAYCDDFGHGENHAILRIGHRAALDTNRCTLTYEN